MTRNHKTRKAATMLAIIGLATPPALAQQPAPIPQAGPPTAQQATPEPQVIAIPVPLPLPGQLKPVPQAKPPHAAGRSRPTRKAPAPVAGVGAANEAARVEPRRDGFINAMQRFVWAEGALYQVYAAPGQITDIALQAGEQLVGAGPVAAGDTVRWIIGDTTSGTGNTTRVHILIKPTRSDLATNLIINTDRRTYHLELRASISTYMASVSWTYPQDELIAIRGRASAAEAAAPVAAGIALPSLSFGYRISGDRPDWRPVRVFDDRVRTFIEFPESIARGEMPPVFVIGASGEGELVNYRVSGHYIIVDRLFAEAELRMGDKRSQQRVHITRDVRERRR
jgi:type IV secretion system protein TrbG